MKGRPDRFFLEVSPSGRACCRRCKRPVAKGDARLSALCSVMPGRVTKMVRHIGCVGTKEVVSILVAHGSIERVPTALSGGMHKDAMACLTGIRDSMRQEAEATTQERVS
jgi:hypothetical protein